MKALNISVRGYISSSADVVIAVPNKRHRLDSIYIFQSHIHNYLIEYERQTILCLKFWTVLFPLTSFGVPSVQFLQVLFHLHFVMFRKHHYIADFYFITYINSHWVKYWIRKIKRIVIKSFKYVIIEVWINLLPCDVNVTN